MIIGIDLGTTNSEVALSRDHRIDVLAEDGSFMVPSCVGVRPDGALVVGAEARNQYVLRPGDTIRSIKRRMGDAETVMMGGKPYTPAEISAFILRELKARAERATGERVTQAVITVPAYFSEVQRQATREAGALAGLEVARIVNEPTAAALAYEAAGVTGAEHILVFDFGGGTFDVSLVNVTGDVVEVRASHGDNHLGGDDIDALLLEDALECLRAQTQGRRPSPVAISRLRLACEQLKIDLSSAANATLAETGLPMEEGEPVDLTFSLSRREFEERVDPLLRRTLESVRNVLTQAGLFPKSIDEILLVGGTTRIPAIADLLETELGKRPRFSVDPDLAVACGAGVMAARLSGETRQRILVDITPYTFGSSCVGEVNGEYGPHLFVPVIKAGTPLPARRGQVFYTLQPGQPIVKIEVFQGESNDARNNVFVGEFRITGLDEEADEGSPILLNMHLDLDGILTATAIEQHTGLSKSVVIRNTLKPLDDDALEASRRKIAELFPDPDIHPIEAEDDEADETDADLVEAFEADDADDDTTDRAVDAAATNTIPPELTQRIRNCRDKLDAVDREDLDRHLEALRQAARDADDDAAARAREAIEDILFYVE